jgi:hypothetical protein
VLASTIMRLIINIVTCVASGFIVHKATQVQARAHQINSVGRVFVVMGHLRPLKPESAESIRYTEQAQSDIALEI